LIVSGNEETPWFVKMLAWVSLEILVWIVVGIIVGLYALFK